MRGNDFPHNPLMTLKAERAEGDSGTSLSAAPKEWWGAGRSYLPGNFLLDIPFLDQGLGRSGRCSARTLP
jgi:hypothetical protein